MSETDSGKLVTRVSRNTAILMTAQVAEKFVNFFLVVFLVRHLPQATFGQYSFVGAFVVLFGAMISLGLAPLCLREISRSPTAANKMLAAAAAPMAVSSALALGLIAVAVGLSKGDEVLVAAAMLAGLELVMSTYTQLVATVPRAHERMELVVAPQLVRSVLVLAACLILIPRGLGLVGIFVIIAAAGAIRLVLQILVSRAVFGISLERCDYRLTARLLREAYPLAMVSVFVIIYYKIDVVMISYLLGDAEASLYAASTTLAFTPLFVAHAFHQATFPLLSKLGGDQVAARLTQAYRLSIKYLMSAGLPIASGLALLAPRLILFVYDDRYVDATGAMRVLAVALLLMFLNGFTGNTLIAIDQQRLLMWIVTSSAAVNVALNFVAIPRFGLVGAAVATVTAEIVAGLASAFAIWRLRGLRLPAVDLAKLLLATAAMGVFVVQAQSLPLISLIPSAAVVYAVLLLVLGVVGRDEIRRLRSVVGHAPEP